MTSPKIQIIGSGVISSLGQGKKIHSAQMHHQGFTAHVKKIEGETCFYVDAIPDQKSGRNQALVMAAVEEAIEEATQLYPKEELLQDCAFLFGSTTIYSLDHEGIIKQAILEGRTEDLRFGQGTREGQMAEELAEAIGTQGPVLSYNTSCTSSLNAVYQGILMLRSKKVKRVLVVGCESLSHVTIRGFSSLSLMNQEGCTPFDKNRSGLALGEGAGAVFLELAPEGETTSQLPKLLGGAIGSDHFHPTAPTPDGTAGQAVIAKALSRANVSLGDIAYIKAHGTGTPSNDLSEGLAFKLVFGDHTPPFSSLKGFLGHTLAASGVIELVALLATTAVGYLPSTAGFHEEDPAIGLSPVTVDQDFAGGKILMNAFGFGGNMVALILEVEK